MQSRPCRTTEQVPVETSTTNLSDCSLLARKPTRIFVTLSHLPHMHSPVVPAESCKSWTQGRWTGTQFLYRVAVMLC